MTIHIDPPPRRPLRSRPVLRRPGRCCLAVAVILGLAAGGCGRRHTIEPVDVNVLLITMDTTRSDHLGCYGAASAQTPHIDRLASEGTRFTRCTACTPLTLPSHCTIMTGTYPITHEVRQNTFDTLDPSAETLAEVLQAHDYRTQAVVGSVVLRRRFGLDQGFDTYDWPALTKSTNVAGATRKGDAVCDAALAQLREHAGQRFFMWVHFFDPHFPYESSRHPAVDSPAAYANEIAFMDTQIGRLVAELDSLGVAGETLIVLVGDHGEGLGDHGESEHGYFVYETTMQAPLIVWCPDVIPAGRVVDTRVATVDLMPTILDLVGRPVPAAVAGTSLRPLLAGESWDPGQIRFAESTAASEVFGLTTLQVLYEDEWKYIHSSSPELYDLAADPAESRNLIADEAERADRMNGVLERLLTGRLTEPGAADDETVELSERELQQLRALGYVGGASSQRKTSPSTTPGQDHPAAHTASIDRFVAAQRLIAAGRFAAAEPVLREVVQAMPGAPLPLRDFELALRKLDREPEIDEFCVRTLAEQPEATGLRVYYARRLIGRHDYEEAVELLRTAVREDPEHAAAHFELANGLRALRQLDEARRHYTLSLGLEPDNSAALQALASICVREEKYTEAVGYLRDAISIEPNSARLQNELQRVLKIQRLEQ